MQKKKQKKLNWCENWKWKGKSIIFYQQKKYCTVVNSFSFSRMCAYQVIRNVSFWKHFAYVLSEYPWLCRGVLRTLSNIYNGAFLQMKDVDCFQKELFHKWLIVSKYTFAVIMELIWGSCILPFIEKPFFKAITVCGFSKSSRVLM